MIIEGGKREIKRGFMPTEVLSEEKIPSTEIREIQVPKDKIDIVKGWAKQAKLKNVRIVPFECYEMQEVINFTKQG
jgi:hypothetical protein